MKALALVKTEYPITDLATIEAGPALDQHPAAVYLASLRPTGRRSMLHLLNVIADLVAPGSTALSLPWWNLRYQHTAAIRTALGEKGFSIATQNTALTAMRRVLQECRKLGLMSAEDCANAIEFKPIKGETLLRGRALAGGELSALMNVCVLDNSPAGSRDAALIAVLYSAGLRRSEVVNLDHADYNAESGALTVRAGKGGKDRITYTSTGGIAALGDWLTIRSDQAGPLFVPVNKGGRVLLGQRMTAQAVFNLLAKRGQSAGVAHFSPHDMRRSMVSDLLDAGADIATVQKLAGHASPITTAKYDRRGEVAKRKAAGLLHVPYHRQRLPI